MHKCIKTVRQGDQPLGLDERPLNWRLVIHSQDRSNLIKIPIHANGTRTHDILMSNYSKTS